MSTFRRLAPVARHCLTSELKPENCEMRFSTDLTQYFQEKSLLKEYKFKFNPENGEWGGL